MQTHKDLNYINQSESNFKQYRTNTNKCITKWYFELFEGHPASAKHKNDYVWLMRESRTTIYSRKMLKQSNQ